MTTLDQLNGTYVIDPTHSQIGFCLLYTSPSPRD